MKFNEDPGFNAVYQTFIDEGLMTFQFGQFPDGEEGFMFVLIEKGKQFMKDYANQEIEEE